MALMSKREWRYIVGLAGFTDLMLGACSHQLLSHSLQLLSVPRQQAVRNGPTAAATEAAYVQCMPHCKMCHDWCNVCNRLTLGLNLNL